MLNDVLGRRDDVVTVLFESLVGGVDDATGIVADDGALEIGGLHGEKLLRCMGE